MYRRNVVYRLIASSIVLFCSCAQDSEIEVWYGKRQHFGRNGYPQKWINVLGRVASSDDISSLHYSLNDASSVPLSIGPDGHRLANPGDFNVDIDRAHLHSGENTVEITARNHKGHKSKTKVVLVMHESTSFPLTSFSVSYDAKHLLRTICLSLLVAIHGTSCLQDTPTLFSLLHLV